MSNFTLKISTEIHSDDYDDSIEVSYPCKYSCDNGVYRFKYTDDEAGFTVFKFSEDGEINIHRQKSFPIVMRQGSSYDVDYETPYGSIPMRFTLQQITSRLTEQGGSFEYTSHVHIDGTLQVNKIIMHLVAED